MSKLVKALNADDDAEVGNYTASERLSSEVAADNWSKNVGEKLEPVISAVRGDSVSRIAVCVWFGRLVWGGTTLHLRDMIKLPYLTRHAAFAGTIIRTLFAVICPE